MYGGGSAGSQWASARKHAAVAVVEALDAAPVYDEVAPALEFAEPRATVDDLRVARVAPVDAPGATTFRATGITASCPTGGHRKVCS